MHVSTECSVTLVTEFGLDDSKGVVACDCGPSGLGKYDEIREEAGYLLVLDDFVFEPKFWPLIDLADIIKVDFLSTGVQERRDIVQRVGSRKIKFLAVKVENQR